ncbi:MAG: alcohol dehydrogenase catalytic domain-containing protein [Aquihabitans sp.]
MRSAAAVLDEVGGSLTIETIEVEEPRAAEVLVRVAHCGVCHSDLSVVDGEFPSPVPVVLGHEAAGVVEAIGLGVVDVRPGDRVVLTPAPNCGHCYFCTRQQPTLCERYRDSLRSSEINEAMADARAMKGLRTVIDVG